MGHTQFLFFSKKKWFLKRKFFLGHTLIHLTSENFGKIFFFPIFVFLQKNFFWKKMFSIVPLFHGLHPNRPYLFPNFFFFQKFFFWKTRAVTLSELRLLAFGKRVTTWATQKKFFFQQKFFLEKNKNWEKKIFGSGPENFFLKNIFFLKKKNV